MRPQDTAYIIERLAVRFMAMVADHERQLAEHRAAFGARTEADAKIISWMREERDRLLTQVQDMRAEMERLREERDQFRNSLGDMLEGEGLQRVFKERDVLRAEVAALQERLRASIARGDFAQMEVAALKSQTSKHPVKVGAYVKRLTGFDTTPAGEIGRVIRVDDDAEPEYEVKRPNGETGVWYAKNCEPCDPPTVEREPEIGDTVRLVRIPSRDDVSPELQKVLEWPWIERWGTLNQTALVVKPTYHLEGALSVCLNQNVHMCWPICCLEVVTEATHDTEAGKAAAEAAVKTEPVADEIKVGDVAKVRSASGNLTAKCDVGQIGEVLKIDSRDGTVLLSGEASWVDIQDVRKVTT